MADTLEREGAGQLVRDGGPHDMTGRAQPRIRRRAVAAGHLARIVRKVRRNPADVFAEHEKALGAVRPARSGRARHDRPGWHAGARVARHAELIASRWAKRRAQLRFGWGAGRIVTSHASDALG